LKNLVSFLKDWKNQLMLGTLVLIGGWVYSRVWMVNPAILGDEYLYSINARKAAPWDPSPAGDFSNYLFNLVYSSTNLCGDAFYACGKYLNLFFFLGFIFIVFLIAKRLMGFWPAYAFTIAAGLSPLSVYTSMFLPESMYFFFLGLVLLAVLKAATNFTWQNWGVVGMAVGVASLTKPHAWMSVIAIGTFMLVVGLTRAELRYAPLFKSIGAAIAGAILGRLVVGFAVGGPKALGFFGQYLGFGIVNEFSANPAGGSESVPASAVGAGPLNGAIALFGPQLNTHLLTVFALMGIAIAGLILGTIRLRANEKADEVNLFALFALIWLGTMIIAIVLFTGWITGGGDDHTTRVLLRYYDFLFVFVPLAGVAAIVQGQAEKANVFVRWGLLLLVGIFITPAFSGFFGSLTIQIADAPNLAGLVVNQDVLNGVALTTALALLILAVAPKYLKWVLIMVLPFTMVGTGWQIQDQYQGFRANESPADIAGKLANSTWSDEELRNTFVLATSRFDATNFAIWADQPNMNYELYGPGSQYDSNLAPEGTLWIVSIGDVGAVGDFAEVIEGEGYKLYKLKG
jgi:phosphoglycerol transferase